MLQGVQRVIIIAFALVHFVDAHPQEAELKEILKLRPGRYFPELHGADRGKYVPDDSGVYHHIKIPYDGGFGDRGIEYKHDLGPVPPEPGDPLKGLLGILGPKDHLRFTIDFNYNEKGWQIIQFHWTRDGEDHEYKYVNENMLWADTGNPSNKNGKTVEDEVVAENVASEGSQEQISNIADGNGSQNPEGDYNSSFAADENDQSVHVTGVYDENSYNYSYVNEDNFNNKKKAQNANEIQGVIKNVLDYVQTNIVPKLT